MTTEESNRIIAEFMGVNFAIYKTAQHPDGYPYTMRAGHGGLEPLQYHASWDWLMPCVKYAKAKPHSSEWDWQHLNDGLKRCDIFDVHLELVEFIKYYNLQTPNP